MGKPTVQECLDAYKEGGTRKVDELFGGEDLWTRCEPCDTWSPTVVDLQDTSVCAYCWAAKDKEMLEEIETMIEAERIG